MKKIYVILLSLTLIGLNSCKDFLEEVPTDFVSMGNFYKTENDIKSALAGVYDVLGKSSAYGRNFFLEMDISDESYYYVTSNVPDLAYYDYQITNGKLEGIWFNMYEGINRANLLIENVDNAEDLSAVEKEAYKAEAIFLRSYYYFILTTNFGSVPLRLASTKTPNEVDLAPTHYSDVYKQIVLDMEYAAEKVPSIQIYNHSGRVTQSAIWGILARVNLKMAGAPMRDRTRYAEAKKWAKKVMDLGFHGLHPDYTQVFKNLAQKVYYNRESIWEVEFAYWSGTQHEEGTVGASNGIATTDRTLGYSYGTQRPMKVYYDRFENGDLRRDWNMSNFTYNSNREEVPLTGANLTIYYNRYSAKYRRAYENNPAKSLNTSIINFPILRYADVLLMYAEAVNQEFSAPTPDALEAVNEVRRRAFGKLLPGATNINEFDLNSMDEINFQTAIQDERSRELGYEALRRFDLIRWGIYIPTMKSLVAYKATAHNNYKVYPFRAAENIADRDTLYGIPSDEMMINKLMVQNRGW
jgi:hypothetical protein